MKYLVGLCEQREKFKTSHGALVSVGMSSVFVYNRDTACDLGAEVNAHLALCGGVHEMLCY